MLAVALALGATVALPPRADAVIFYATGDSGYNTTAPTGSLANSGWQWSGAWGGFSGTAIGPRHFIAAKHVGGTVGDPFTLNGTSYTTTAFFDDASSDLRIWEISGSFPTWAPLYRTSNEVGRSLAVFGRGLSRGGEIQISGTLKGWYWGSGSGPMRWGENAVASVATGGASTGDLLYATFDASGGPNEAHLATGDSSGGVFIHDGTGWKLAGIAYSVNGPFNTTNTGSGFNAAIFDAGGLYYWNNNSWQLITDQSTDIPSGFYATRVSAHTAWIDSILATATAPSVSVPLLDSAQLALLAGSFAAIGLGFIARQSRRNRPA